MEFNLIFRFDADLNRNLSAQMLFRFSNRWYALRMDLLGTLTILITAGVCIFSRYVYYLVMIFEIRSNFFFTEIQ